VTIEWTDHRVGLRYEEDDGNVFYCPSAPFYVDGIRYDQEYTGVWVSRTMIATFDDHGGEAARMDCSRPPTDAELDEMVRTGLLGGKNVFHN
jgi:hypothetical protein